MSHRQLRKSKKNTFAIDNIRNKSDSTSNTLVSNADHLSCLSDEILCKIMDSLHVSDILRLSLMSKRLNRVVELHLNLRKVIHFLDGKLQGYLPAKLQDDQLYILMQKCSKVEFIYGFNPMHIEKRRSRKGQYGLSIPGVLSALCTCAHLKGIETSHLQLMEAILRDFPHVTIVGHFRNADCRFPISDSSKLRLPCNPLLSSLHLTGVEILELPPMPQLQYLYLQWVQFTQPHPFRDFSAPKLHTFVMRHCWGPTNPVRYFPLMFALAGAINLKRVEFINVSFLGRLLQRVAEDHWRLGTFRKLEKVVFGACRSITESDLGYLLIVCSNRLQDFSLQPSLTRDSFLASLQASHIRFPQLVTLHLGFVDSFPRKGIWFEEDLVSYGLADMMELPAPITDIGLRRAGQLFPHLKTLSIYNCPHLVHPTTWTVQGDRTAWSHIVDLTLSRCHCLRLEDFMVFLKTLVNLETLTLEEMFREPPKGCSHVGLSAGTGLGMSSAIVSNQQEQVAVNGQQVVDAEEAIAGAHPEAPSSDNEDQQEPEEEQHIFQQDDPDDDAEDQCAIEDTDAEKCEMCGLLLKTDDEVVDFDNPRPGTSNPVVCKCSSTASNNENRNRKRKRRTCSKKMRKSSRRTYEEDDDYENMRMTRGRCLSLKKKKRDQGSMVTSDDIRQEVRKANTLPTGKKLPGRKGDFVERVVEGQADRFIPATFVRNKPQSSNKSVPEMLDKAISTSDPLLEDDYQQVMKMTSKSLRSLTVIGCGISDIIMKHCSRLHNLHIEACTILQHVRLNRCPVLDNIHISQCPKLNLISVVKELCQLPASCDRRLFVQPFLAFHQLGMEKAVFQTSLMSYGIALVVDHGSRTDDRFKQRNMMNRWLQLCKQFNKVLIGQKRATKIKERKNSRSKFPWGRNIFWLQGRLSDGPFEVITDIQWLHELWFTPPSEKEDFETQGTARAENMLSSMGDYVNELCESNRKLPLAFLTIYIHMADIIHRRNSMQKVES